MSKKLLAIFAHPDDEVFGPGGTLAKYSNEGVEVHLLCATRGERGQLHQSLSGESRKIQIIREKELVNSARILGITKVEFLDFKDGELSNSIYHELADKIIAKMNSFDPQIVITNERRGISGHLDHIAVSMITTYSYIKSKKGFKLYYFCLSEDQRRRERDDYFVYFPEGYPDAEITTRIDYSNYFIKKKDAMYEHKSQLDDVKRIYSNIKGEPKIENFILQFSRLKKPSLPETDLFTGV